MAASVRIEDEAFSDDRYDDLAHLAGLPDADCARGKMARIWRQCTIEQRHTLPRATVQRILGPRGVDALIGSRLGEAADDDLVRIRGTRGRIEWLKKLRNNGKFGGRGGRPKKNPRGFPPDNPDGGASGSGNETPPAPAPAPAPAQEKEPEIAAPPLALSAPLPKAEDRATALSKAAVDEINRLRGSRYKPDSKETLEACRALAKRGVTPEKLVAAIRHIACPRQGSEGWLAVEHLRDRVCPETLLQTKRVMTTIATIEATAGPPQLRIVPRADDDYSRIPGMGDQCGST